MGVLIECIIVEAFKTISLSTGASLQSAAVINRQPDCCHITTAYYAFRVLQSA